MISFDSDRKLFCLTNKSISLFIHINSIGLLETFYFGKYKENIEFPKYEYDNFSKTFYDTQTKTECVYEDSYSNRFSRMELADHGLSDNRPAPLILQKSNGDYSTSFTYISHEIYQGFPRYEKGPHVVGENGETLCILLKDEFSETYVKYNISISKDADIVVKNFEITNKNKTPVNILRAMSYELDLEHDNYEVHHFAGKWSDERNEKINDVIDGTQIVSSNYGRSSHEFNPFVFICEKKASFDKGEVIGFNLVYSGNFKFEILNDYYRKPRIIYGLNDQDFNWFLDKNDTFITPQAVVSYSSNGIEKMSQNFHKFIKKNIIQYKNDLRYKPIIFNSWEGCEMNFNTDSLIEYFDESIKIGAELFVLDDGWFLNRNTDSSSLGDWIVDDKKVDLKKVIDHIHKNGCKFGLWFEPEMISVDSNLYREHPDFAIGGYRRRQSIHRHQLCLDMSNHAVVDNIFEQMCKILDNYQIDYIKWDHNRDIKEHYLPYLGDKHQGEAYHRLVLGYYDLIERITKRYPNIMVEGCCSGGGRYDLGTLFYTPQIWTSDNSRPSARVKIQFNTSLGYPLSTMGSHVNNSEETSYQNKAYLALFGTYGFEFNPTKINDEDREQIKIVSEVYKKYHNEVFENGTLYHLSSPTTGLMSMQVVNENKDKSIVILMKNADFNVSRVLLKGLKEDCVYLANGNKIEGLSLMEKGLLVDKKTLKNNFDAELVILEVAK